MNFIKLVLVLIKWALILFLTLLGAYFLFSNVHVFGGLRSYVVQSGSMEPAIMTGDVVIVQSKSNYSINDVVTFNDSSTGRVVTHRIIEAKNSNQEFQTKGDANRTGDDAVVSLGQIIGKVVFVIPKIGYLVSFTKTLMGLVLLVLVPAAIFVLDELIKIMKNAK